MVLIVCLGTTVLCSAVGVLLEVISFFILFALPFMFSSAIFMPTIITETVEAIFCLVVWSI